MVGWLSGRLKKGLEAEREVDWRLGGRVMEGSVKTGGRMRAVTTNRFTITSRLASLY